jgi:hypothetical protein
VFHWRHNGLIAVLFALAMLADTVARLVAGQPVASNNFCAEQGNVAASLANGHGFADALGTPSGPTAWVPPVFPAYLAGVFTVFGIKTAASLKALLLLDCVLATCCVLALVGTLDLAGFPGLKAWLAAAVFVLIIVDQEGSMGLWFSTSWFVAALGSWVLLSASCVGLGLRGWTLPLALVASAAALTHAGTGLAAVVSIVCAWAYSARSRLLSGSNLLGAIVKSARGPATALAAVALVVGAWTARNALVFRQIIPLKSTGWYETWLAASFTSDGVIDDAVMLGHSPYCNFKLLEEYTIEGEAVYLDGFRAKARAVFAAKPGIYLSGIAGRARNIFLFCDTAPHAVLLLAAIPAADVDVLVKADLVAALGNPGPVFWTSLELSPGEFRRRTSGLALARPNIELGDWIRAKRHRIETESSGMRILSEISLSFLPTACLLTMFLLWRERIPFVFGLAGVFYLTALLPNILITHYSQHSLNFIGVHVFLGMGAVAALARKGTCPTRCP